MEEEMLASDNNNDAGGDVEQQQDEGGETGLSQDRTPECSGEEEQEQEQQETAATADDYEPCDPLIVLNLFQSLSSTTSSLELQIKINKHVSEDILSTFWLLWRYFKVEWWRFVDLYNYFIWS